MTRPRKHSSTVLKGIDNSGYSGSSRYDGLRDEPRGDYSRKLMGFSYWRLPGIDSSRVERELQPWQPQFLHPLSGSYCLRSALGTWQRQFLPNRPLFYRHFLQQVLLVFCWYDVILTISNQIGCLA
jgi:hypothetical protein